VGQDFSDRALQYASQPPQFSLGKSRRNFSPFGPWLVDARDVENRDALSMSCSINGEEVQQTLTSDLIFSVPEIITYLSGICQLLPGDVIFTGTPAGVGVSRDPKRFLSPGDVVVSTLEHVGSTVNRCV
jgi:2-keto-4-pentenoate hydratase/2-oxohepta-3-ene-1,7-dioic acid hydratase in catechol pathway